MFSIVLILLLFNFEWHAVTLTQLCKICRLGNTQASYVKLCCVTELILDVLSGFAMVLFGHYYAGINTVMNGPNK